MGGNKKPVSALLMLQGREVVRLSWRVKATIEKMSSSEVAFYSWELGIYKALRRGPKALPRKAVEAYYQRESK